jgi:putative peptidoglycan lipid II flippase
VSEQAALDPAPTPSQGLGRDTLIVTLCTLVSRLTGFGRVLATAAVVGSGLLGDVYQSANLIPNLLFELAAGGVLQGVLLPSFVAARRTGGDHGLGDAAGATAGVLLVGLGAVTAVGMMASPFLARVLVAAEPSATIAAEKLDVMVPMALVFVPQLICYGLGMVATAALAARGRFVAAALAPAVNNLIVIGACIAFRAARSGQEATLDLTPWQFALLAGGTTLGVIAFSAVPAVALVRHGVRWRPRLAWHHPAVRSLRASFGWATLSVVGTLVPTSVALAVGNGATGGVAVFVLAFAFFVLPHALVAVPVATTLAPRVAYRWQVDDTDGLRADVAAALRTMIPLLLLAGAGMLALAWPVARVAAFGQTASQGVAPIAHAIAAFGPGLFGYGMAFVMLRLLFSIDEMRVAALLTVAGAVLGVAWMVTVARLVSASDRAAALAVGYGISQTVAAVLLAGHLQRRTGTVPFRAMSRLLAESITAAALSAAVMVAIASRFEPTRRMGLAAIVVAGSAGVVVFGGALAALRGGRLFDRGVGRLFRGGV